MNVLDSSGWLEYFTDGPNARHFAAVAEKPEGMLIPSITLLEVFKWVARVRDADAALQYVAVMQQSEVVVLDASLAMNAAAFGLRHRLPLADSVVYATARAANAVVWTQDSDFEGLEGVKYFPRR